MVEKIKVFLTARQRLIYKLYVTDGLTQEEIAIRIFNNKYRQGNVSLALASISQQIYGNRKTLTAKHSKAVEREEFEVEL